MSSRMDTSGRLTTYTYDEQDRLIGETNPAGEITQKHYNSAGQLEWVRDARQLQTNYTYNGFGQRLTISSPDTGTTTYTYDLSGDLDTETRADGKTINYDWDSLGRMIRRSSGGQIESFNYDAGAYGKGRLTSIVDSTGTTSFEYDSVGAIIRQTNNVLGSIYVTSWSYDPVGRLKTMTYPDGVILTYQYNAYGQLSSITSNLVGGSATLVDSFLYQPVSGALVRMAIWK
ncbi:hypothetical protein LP420_38095 [Massilia sp. B-10]|nr:hypothetical protein LP420_38095 [Massilia sp. B-10]